MNNPSPRKQLDDRDIYLSRNYWGLSPEKLGRAVITDLGLAVRGDGPPNSHYIQPEGYRASEVCLGGDWSYSVDVWNLGVMVKDLVIIIAITANSLISFGTCSMAAVPSTHHRTRTAQAQQTKSIWAR